MDWVEASGKSVDLAVDAALAELGLESRDAAVIEVIQEPKTGFLGLGATAAVVKVSPKPPERKRKRRRGGRRKSGRDADRVKDDGQQQGRKPASRPDGGGKGPREGRRKGEGETDRRPDKGGSGPQRSPQGNGGVEQGATSGGRSEGSPKEAGIKEQADVAVEFVKGLLDAYGLEGEVTAEIDDDVLKIDVEGGQTEALVGPKGAVMQSVLEITRTVVQRKTFGAPRMRLDIAGYNERRREALRIYAGKLAEKVIGEGGEVMLEPMNPADRKVIHDAVADIDGVRSFSEGEDPDRAVVIASE